MIGRRQPRARLLIGLLALVGGLPACSPRNNHTLLVVRVDSDLATPADLDDILVTATSPSGDKAQADFSGAAAVEMGVRPKDGDSFAVTVTATATHQGTLVVTQTVKTAFAPGKAQTLTLTLTRACATLTPACTDGQTCVSGQCVAQTDAIPPVPFDPRVTSDASVAPDTAVATDSAPALDAETDSSPVPDAASDGATTTGTWMPITGAPAGAILSSVWPISATDVWAVGSIGGAGVAVHFDGNAWTKSASLPATTALAGVWAAGPDDVWTVGAGGRVMHFSGGTWTMLPTLGNKNLSAIWGSSANDVWAVGSGGTVLHFVARVGTPDSNGISGGLSLLAITGSGATDLWIGGSDGTIFRRAADRWERQPTETLSRSIIWGLWSPAPGQIWAVTTGAALRFDGARWTLTSGSPRGAVSIWGSGASDIWAVGVPNVSAGVSSGPIGHWNGAAWADYPSPDGVSLQSVRGLSATDVWAVGAAGAILHFQGP